MIMLWRTTSVYWGYGFVNIDLEYPGDVGGIYPSAILAVLPRLLSAAAPPGSVAQENRRQCLKASEVFFFLSV